MSTASQVDLYFTYRVKDGQQARFEQYLELVPPVTEEREPYVLEYEIFQHADGSYLQHERYEDEAAMMRHLQVTAQGQAAWAQATELLQLMAVGDLSEQYWTSYGGPRMAGYQRFREVAR